MSKTFDEVFDDSTDFTFYRITITSENDQEQVFDGVSDRYARDVFEGLAEQAAEDEL